jgi:hypothetical protein
MRLPASAAARMMALTTRLCGVEPGPGMIGRIGKLAKQLQYRWRSRDASPRKPRVARPWMRKPWARKPKGQKPGWGEAYYGYSRPSDVPPRFGAADGPYDNNRPRGLAGLVVEAILRRLARR